MKNEVSLLVHKQNEKPQVYTLVHLRMPPNDAKGSKDSKKTTGTAKDGTGSKDSKDNKGSKDDKKNGDVL
jgi:hypothetical protein